MKIGAALLQTCAWHVFMECFPRMANFITQWADFFQAQVPYTHCVALHMDKMGYLEQ